MRSAIGFCFRCSDFPVPEAGVESVDCRVCRLFDSITRMVTMVQLCMAAGQCKCLAVMDVRKLAYDRKTREGND